MLCMMRVSLQRKRNPSVLVDENFTIIVIDTHDGICMSQAKHLLHRKLSSYMMFASTSNMAIASTSVRNVERFYHMLTICMNAASSNW